MAWIPFVQNILYFHMIDKSGWHVLIFMLPVIFFINSESHVLFAIGVLFSLGLTVFYAFWTADFVKRFGFDPIWTISIFFPIVYFVLLFTWPFLRMSNMWPPTDTKMHMETQIINNYKKRDENHSSRSLFFVDDSFKCIITHFDAFFLFCCNLIASTFHLLSDLLKRPC